MRRASRADCAVRRGVVSRGSPAAGTGGRYYQSNTAGLGRVCDVLGAGVARPPWPARCASASSRREGCEYCPRATARRESARATAAGAEGCDVPPSFPEACACLYSSPPCSRLKRASGRPGYLVDGIADGQWGLVFRRRSECLVNPKLPRSAVSSASGVPRSLRQVSVRRSSRNRRDLGLSPAGFSFGAITALVGAGPKSSLVPAAEASPVGRRLHHRLRTP